MNTNSITAGALIVMLSIPFICLAESKKSAGHPVPVMTPQTEETASVERGINDIPTKDIERFSAALSHIKSFYVDTPEDGKLFGNAIRGMLTGLDPHSDFLDEQELHDLQVSTSGEYSGLGLEITQVDGFIKVISPIDDSPAFKAKVQSGDIILKIDGKSVQGLTLSDAVTKMRGKEGQKITLTMFRKGADKTVIEIPMVREKIVLKSVQAKLYDGKFGYIRVSHFQEKTSADLERAIESLRKESNQDLRGLVLDLRNNPGGLFESAVKVSDQFLDKDTKGQDEVIVSTRGRAMGSESITHASLTPDDLTRKFPLVVLINQGSASASEIVAGALQDNKRAVVMGTRSFGKGSVQTVLPLDDTTAIKLTTARYYTPSGRSIQAKGIDPDIVIENIRFPKEDKKSDEPSGALISESDLENHLTVPASPQAKDKKGDKKSERHDEKKEEKKAEKKAAILPIINAQEDYQLHEALNLIQAMSIMNQRLAASAPKPLEEVGAIVKNSETKKEGLKN